MRNDFESLTQLHPDVLSEIVREGEMRLSAQLQVATAADQRALTFGGFLIAAATAALGGGIALLAKESPDVELALLAIAFAAAQLWAAWLAISTVSPKLFDLPGNRPGNWLPHEWQCHGLHKPTMVRARIEQAMCVDRAIKDNAEVARVSALCMRKGIKWAAGAVLVGGITLLILMMYRHVTIEEPGSHPKITYKRDS